MAQVPPPGATAEVRDASNRVVATAEFREGRGEVLITLAFPNPPVLSGTHAIHINDTGRCDPPDYTTSGNIFNPLNKKHGRQNPEGSEVGDLPNVNFSTGLTSYNTTATGATLGGGTTSLLSPARALVIYSGEDDQKTDPEGNPGSRIACGVIMAAAGGAVVAAAQPTLPPTPAVAASQPRIASPVPVQPVAGQPAQPRQPAQPVQQIQPAQAAQPGQPGAGQPAQPGAQPKPANTPIVVGKPAVVVNAAASPSPVVVQGVAPAAAAPAVAVPTPIVAQAIPTPIVVAAAQSPQSSGGLSNTNALLIAILGVGLVGIGWFLRQRRQLR
jgi:Cu-Zn family superoxide dismutase